MWGWIPEEDGADHDGDVQAESLEEAGTLQGDVGGANQQRLPRGVGQAEQIVRGDAQLSVACENKNPI